MSIVTVDPKFLRKAAQFALTAIKRNTQLGLDRYGRPFRPYSTKPFGMPLGAFLEVTTKRQRGKLNAEGDLQIYRSKRTGKRWVIVDGGYLNFKQKWSPAKSSVVNMMWRGLNGGMLGAMDIIAQDDSSITIGFNRQEAAQLAYYHQVSGASKSRVKREFFGIPAAEQQIIADIIQKGLRLDLKNLPIKV